MYTNIRFLYNFFYFFLVSPLVTARWLDWGSMVRFYFGNLYFYTPKYGVNQFHPFHILAVSPWPLLVAVAILALVAGVVEMLTMTQDWGFSVGLGLGSVILVVWLWWADVINESLVEHTKVIKIGIGIGMILFIVSEVMFFFSFFWAFFHVSLSPGIELGCVWPPKGLESLVIAPFGAPLLNTIVLVVSGVTVTCAHHAFLFYSGYQRQVFNFLTIWGEFVALKVAIRCCLVMRRLMISLRRRDLSESLFWYLIHQLRFSFSVFKDSLYYGLLNPLLGIGGVWGYVIVYFCFTLMLAVLFTVSQGLEYVSSVISISDSVYGSTFFVMTGFHGFHVLVGTVFLTVCFVRILRHRVSFVKTIGLECAIWYWHFVDVVWLFLFIFVYIWGNGLVSVVDLETVASTDFAVPWQLNFQDGASVLMELIVDLHNYVMFYLFVILGLVVWLLIAFTVLNPNNEAARLFVFMRFLFGIAYDQERVKRRLFFLFHSKELDDLNLAGMSKVRDRGGYKLRPLVRFLLNDIAVSQRRSRKPLNSGGVADSSSIDVQQRQPKSKFGLWG